MIYFQQSVPVVENVHAKKANLLKLSREWRMPEPLENQSFDYLQVFILNLRENHLFNYPKFLKAFIN